MKDQILIQTKEIHIYCINFNPKHYQFLIELSETKFEGDLEQTLIYLFSKYMKYLYRIRIRNKKMTTLYQPSTKEYQKCWLQINPTHMAKLKHLRCYLGYSVSFILRILIEWEWEELLNGDVIIQKPELTEQELREIQPSFLHSYEMKVRVNYVSRFVFMNFRDYYY